MDWQWSPGFIELYRMEEIQSDFDTSKQNIKILNQGYPNPAHRQPIESFFGLDQMLRSVSMHFPPQKLPVIKKAPHSVSSLNFALTHPTCSHTALSLSPMCPCWQNVSVSVPLERRLAIFLLTTFWTTYTCESSFSHMNATKTNTRASLTCSHLHQCLRLAVTSYEPDFHALAKSNKVSFQSLDNKHTAGVKIIHLWGNFCWTEIDMDRRTPLEPKYMVDKPFWNMGSRVFSVVYHADM